jgi:hypothetical protein
MSIFVYISIAKLTILQESPESGSVIICSDPDPSFNTLQK